MKYIEELNSGCCFIFKNEYFIITIDFKSNNQKLCYNLRSGFPSWFNADTIVEEIQIYTMDQQNLIIPIKETPKTNN